MMTFPLATWPSSLAGQTAQCRGQASEVHKFGLSHNQEIIKLNGNITRSVQNQQTTMIEVDKPKFALQQ